MSPGLTMRSEKLRQFGQVLGPETMTPRRFHARYVVEDYGMCAVGVLGAARLENSEFQ